MNWTKPTRIKGRTRCQALDMYGRCCRPHPCYGVVEDTGKEGVDIYRTGVFQPDNDDDYGLRHMGMAEVAAGKWLEEHYPDHQDICAYWDIIPEEEMP